MIYTLRFDRPALALIGEALGNMPHRQVAALIGTIQQQINAQEAAAAGNGAAAATAAPQPDARAMAAEVDP